MAGLLDSLTHKEEPSETLSGMIKKELPVKNGITVHRLCKRFGVKDFFAMESAIGELENKGLAFIFGFEHDGQGTMYPKYSSIPRNQE